MLVAERNWMQVEAYLKAGGDRAVLSREIEKLALFLDAAPDRPHDLDDGALDAIGADLGEAETSRVVDAVIGGQTAALGAELGQQPGQ